jgi:hypothetical protein
MNTPPLTQTEQTAPAQIIHSKRLIKRRNGIERSELFTIEMRFKHGSFSVSEVCGLAGISANKFYQDRAAGLVVTFKRGRQTAIAGPVAARYLGFDLEK